MLTLVYMVGAHVFFVLSLTVTLATVVIWCRLIAKVWRALGDPDAVFAACICVLFLGGFNAIVGLGAYTITMFTLDYILGTIS